MRGIFIRTDSINNERTVRFGGSENLTFVNQGLYSQQSSRQGGGKYVATDVKYGAGIERGGEEDDLQR